MELFDFYRLFQAQGGYSLPVLVEVRHPGSDYIWRFTNNMTDVTFKGNTYEATTITYNPPTSKEGIQSGGSLEIAIQDNYEQYPNDSFLKFIETSDEQINITVRAVIFDDQEPLPENRIREISSLEHKYGSVSWDGEKIVWNLGEDDRLQMVINPWVLDSTALID
jgi:hypothetical protein